MARSTFEIKCSCGYEQAKNQVESILRQRNFHLETLKTGETVWKCGIGLLTAMKFIKVDFGNQSITLSAWVQVGIGSTGGGEMALDGFTAAIPKKQLKKIIEEIKCAF